MATKKTADPSKKKAPDPWKTARPAKDLSQLNFLKVCIYGPNGSGKSRMGAMFEKPLIGATELQGIPTIRKANPEAVIYHDAAGEPGIKTVDDLRRFVTMARTAADHGCDAVVLDGLTDAQRILRSFYTGNQGEKAGHAKTSMESWGLTIDATARLAREFRDLSGVHVLITCLDDEIEIEGELVHRPGLSGKRLPNDIGQYFNVVGYSHIVEFERGLRHQVMFRGVDRYRVKGLEGLDRIEPPEPLCWVSKTMGDPMADEVQARAEEWEKMSTPSDEDDDE